MIYCVIVTYNGMRWIDRCLQSILQSVIPMVAVVVDNGSEDDTVKHIKANYPEVILLPQEENKGFGQANNIGIAYAMQKQATHILLLNQDAAIQPDALQILLQHDDGQHLLTPIHMNGDGSCIDDNFFQNTLLSMQPEKHEVKEVPYVNAACWLLPIEIIRQVGGFNPLFYHYGEDNNYIQRLQYYHFEIRLISDAIVYHDREKHGNEQLYRSGVLYRKLLLIATDINLTALQRWAKRHKISIQEIGHSMKKHYFLACMKDYFAALRKLTAQSKAIRKSRQIEANTIGAWLTL